MWSPFCEELYQSIDILIERSRSFLSRMTLTEEVTKTVKGNTRGQSHSSKTFLFAVQRKKNQSLSYDGQIPHKI